MSAHKILSCVSVASAGILGALALSSGAQAAECERVVSLHVGGPAVIEHGRLTDTRSSCTYLFRAHRGEKLQWEVSGAATRQVITGPNGEGEGPGFANPYPITQTGQYELEISANLMAEGAYGKYTLRLRLKH